MYNTSIFQMSFALRNNTVKNNKWQGIRYDPDNYKVPLKRRMPRGGVGEGRRVFAGCRNLYHLRVSWSPAFGSSASNGGSVHTEQTKNFPSPLQPSHHGFGVRSAHKNISPIGLSCCHIWSP